MAYPRQCAGCDVEYASLARQGNYAHVTLSAQDGGTTSPWVLDRPGRILDIGCKLCGSIYQWDYFGRTEGAQLGTAISLLRGPVGDWKSTDGGADFEIDRWSAFEPQRRAS